MDEATLQAILDSLSYADVARVLEEKCQVKVAPSTIYDFLRVRAKAKAKGSKPAGKLKAEKGPTGEASPPENQERTVEERIAAVKQRTAAAKSQKPVFTYREDEPLTLRPSPSEEEEV
jgi:IS30 family transposase